MNIRHNCKTPEELRAGEESIKRFDESLECCKFHNRLDLKFPNEEYDDPSCGLAGMGSERYNEYRFCCENCPDRKPVIIKHQLKKSLLDEIKQ